MVTVFIDSKAISESDVLNVFHSVYLGKPLDQNKRESMKWFADEDAGTELGELICSAIPVRRYGTTTQARQEVSHVGLGCRHVHIDVHHVEACLLERLGCLFHTCLTSRLAMRGC